MVDVSAAVRASRGKAVLAGAALLFALSAGLAGTALAEPYLAVREGYNCGGCHTNITGGGKRTDIVATHARQLLHYPDFMSAWATPADTFTGEINKYVGIGANVRLGNLAVLQDEADASGRVANNTAFRGRLESNTLDVSEAVAFLDVRLIPERLSFYLDQRFAPNTDTREVFALLRGLPANGFIKAGRMFLPYGLQLQDDAAFIRAGKNGSATTNFSFNTRQSGFEAGIEPGPYSAIIAVSDGAAGDRDVWLTGTVSAMWTELPVVRNLLLGVSAARMGGGSETLAVGCFGGTSLGPLTGLAEADFLDTRTASSGGHQGTFVAYGELNWLLAGWLNLKAALDYADDDGDISRRADDSENRVSLGLEPFLNRFLQPRLFYRVSNGVRAQPSHNQDQLLAELHLFF
ncbi:MAG: hypothetical protein HY699_24340 [Deltaproteobacteria bacterium]|nr:hypothetical protein [Deltaproteobacteria bacterium]